MTLDDVRALLAERVNGNQLRWANENGMSAPYVSDVITGKRDPGPMILKALGLKRVLTFVPETAEGEANLGG